ncbi:MAG: bifunctional riboflavin kinase/FAD synthetase [Tranquillimonas sp.]|jgi:riboflavin kinase/FMN adenylyltransferase
MRILRDYQFIAPEDRGASAAIGNFDGVHLGHRAVIDLARDRARAADAPLGVVTFEPHPREFFAPDAAPFRLMNAEAKANRLAKLGVERLFELNFTAALSSLSPRDFAAEVIDRGLGLSHVVVGADFRFGKGRAGTARDLCRFGQELGFGVTAAPLLETGGIEVSSTRIREALSAGRPDLAARMLGHHHRIEGAVIRGDQRGRLLGYPTANMSIAGLHPPRFGIYAVQVDVLTGPHSGRRHGVASVGTRPTFGEHAPNIETFLFDFRGDLYGEHLSVALIEFLRPEQRFPSPEALVAQMDRDSAAARDALAARAPARPV